MPPCDLMCLVVSLARSTERRKAIAMALNSLNIEFSFIDAIDADAGFDQKTESDLLRPADGSISDGELACALSHRTAYDRLLSSDCSHALILEDDAVPGNDLESFCQQELYRTFPMLLLFHSRARVLKSQGATILGSHRSYPLAMSCTGAVAYSIDRASARALRQANTPVRNLADWPMDISTLGARVLQPMIVGHPERSGDQSLLTPDRSGNSREFNAARWLTSAYMRRKWLKWISTRIS